jgi:ketose-bisphosphate aldolase
MLAHGAAILQQARAERRAVPAFTVYTLESIRAVCVAAERANLPVILQAGYSSYRATSRTTLAAAAFAAACEASVPVGVHLDHATDPAEISACVRLGYTSVMVDGSHLGFEDNIALTRIVVDDAHQYGVWVEAELGAVSGDEDASLDASAGELTDPEQVAEFVERTRVDALAIAVGTVHGFSAFPIRLDLDRLREIANLCAILLVLHGASGLADTDLTAALALGIAKVNINAELRYAYLDVLAAASTWPGDDLLALQDRSIAAMSAVASRKLVLLSGRTSAVEGMTTKTAQ